MIIKVVKILIKIIQNVIKLGNVVRQSFRGGRGVNEEKDFLQNYKNIYYVIKIIKFL